MKKLFWSFVGLIIFSCITFAAFQSESWDLPSGLTEYQVIRVIDGDTIEVSKLGTIRYIGVNTPETKHPTKGIEPYGKEAFEANKNLVQGKKVKIQLDVQERDKYGRILAYVYVGSTFVNAYLVEAGFAQVMTIPPNVKFADLFVKLQKEAFNAERGMWKLVSSKTQPKSAQIYIASLKSDKFHYPSCKSVKKISPNNLIEFRNREEAIKSGYIPCKVCKP